MKQKKIIETSYFSLTINDKFTLKKIAKKRNRTQRFLLKQGLKIIYALNEMNSDFSDNDINDIILEIKKRRNSK